MSAWFSASTKVRAERLGPLRGDRLAMRASHRPDDVGVSHQLRGQRLRLVVGQLQAHLRHDRRPPSGLGRAPIMADRPADITITP